MEQKHLVIVGAGWSGLIALKTFAQLHPTSEVCLLDDSSSVGGVWATSRLHPGLKSNNLAGSYEYSDYPMKKDPLGISPSNHLPGTAIQSYLKGFVEHFNLENRIWLNTRVIRAELQNDGTWQIEARVKRKRCTSERDLRIRSDNLIVATGLSSTPSQPEFRGQEDFGNPCTHSKYFPQYEKQILQHTHNITVLGAGKSAWDIVYASATSGCTVDWIIRETGHGPSWMLPPFMLPWKRWRSEYLSSIPLLWLVAPSVWGRDGPLSRLHRWIHSMAVAAWIISAGWAFVGIFILWMLGYDRHPEVKKLKPWVPLTPFVTSFGIFNYPTDFFQYVESGMVRVHIDDIDYLAPSAVCLKSGTSLQSSALVCATGWKTGPGFPITSADGQAICPPRADPELLDGARSHLYDQFPGLARVPVTTQKPHHENEFPSNLARFMVPLDRLTDRSIVFLGRIETPHTAILAQAQALWAVAYLGGRIKLGPHKCCRYDESAGQCNSLLCLRWESALQGEFCRIMAPPGRTKRKPQMLLDALLYVDVLLADLGLDSRRTGNPLLELFHSYGPMDYRGLIDEWKHRQ